MQLRGSWGLCDPGPVAQRGTATGPGSVRAPQLGRGRAEGGGRRGGQGQARVEFFSQLLQTGVPRFLIQSDGHFSGEGAEPPNFRQEPPPMAGAAEKPNAGVADLLWPSERERGQGPHYNA